MVSGGEVVGLTEKEIETLLNVLRAIEDEDIKRIKDKLKNMCI